MAQLDLTYLNGPDVERLALTDDEILGAVEAALRAQGLGQTVIEPRVHLVPDPAVRGHFNVLRGSSRRSASRASRSSATTSTTTATACPPRWRC